MWYKDTLTTAEEGNTGWDVGKKHIINNSNPKGTFSFKIPLKYIFGFCEDYDKVLYGLKHTLTLTKNDDNDAILRAANNVDGNPVAAGKITLSKIS